MSIVKAWETKAGLKAELVDGENTTCYVAIPAGHFLHGRYRQEVVRFADIAAVLPSGVSFGGKRGDDPSWWFGFLTSPEDKLEDIEKTTENFARVLKATVKIPLELFA